MSFSGKRGVRGGGESSRLLTTAISSTNASTASDCPKSVATSSPSATDSPSRSNPPDTFQALFNHALDLLSRREHSCEELRQKLTPRHPEADFDGVLLRLQELNYQSDQRFAEVFCRSRVYRGQGPMRIRQELQLRGIRGAQAQEAMDRVQEDVDWFELAHEQLVRKFRTPIDVSLPREQKLKERARRQRYLSYRGFFGDAIQYAIEALNSQAHAAQD
ncbi:regulatory protein RecX [Microbulbifer agarilyticus]|uniref:regulatory protein RecX n=1 Tax=Microbulbifer agarilyticus TaxID=260552 RepID=UPI001CD38FA8|nr:regulatory protein RecX [Microbulbifer agarilyticus]MCA0901964.1 recombination regulator RecX [Microbulbifer agarilyticus]